MNAIKSGLCAWVAGLLALSGCASAELSVGDVPCVGDSTHCVRARGERLDGMLAAVADPGAAGTATTLWDRSLMDFGCDPPACKELGRDFVVEEDGVVGVTLRGRQTDGVLREVTARVMRIDAAGNVIEQKDSVLDLASGRAFGGANLQLVRTRTGRLIALIMVDNSQAPGVTLWQDWAVVYELAADWGFERVLITEPSFLFTQLALSEDNLIVNSISASESPPCLSSYRPDGSIAWRQTAVASVPDAGKVPTYPDPNEPTSRMLQLVGDQHSQTWAFIAEQTSGLARFDANGNTLWHGWLNFAPDSRVLPPVFDSRARAVIALGTRLLRFDPAAAASDANRLMITFRPQEFAFEPSISALAVGAQDCIYIATPDGSVSARRVMIERISEDFSSRKLYAIKGMQTWLDTLQITNLAQGKNGELYVGYSVTMSETLQEFRPFARGRLTPARIARLQLTEP